MKGSLVAAWSAVLLVSASASAGDDPMRDRQWGLDLVRAPGAWTASQGAGVTIAIVDSGVDHAHHDLSGKVLRGIDLVDGGLPQDEDGHGTHVAGIAAAAAGNDVGVVGVAPRAHILPVRVLDEEGRGRASDVAAGIRWAADRGAAVINLSLGDLGQPLFGPEFASAIHYAWSKGSICVVAAGNDYLLSSGYEDEPAIVVSAVDRDARKPAYSSGVGSARWGLAAPGGAGSILEPREADVLSTYWRPRGSNEYAYLAGTSMAAPHVAGAAAILRSLGATPGETVERILGTARDIGPRGRDATFGSGLLDLTAAVQGLGGGVRGPGPSRTPAPPGAPSPASPPQSPTATGGPTLSAPGAAPDRADGPSPPAGGAEAAAPAPTGDGDEPPVGAAAAAALIVAVAVLGWVLFRPGP